MPVPFGTGPNFAGLVTIELPQGIVQGQEFLITVKRIATHTVRSIEVPKIFRPSAGSKKSDERFVDVQDASDYTIATSWRYTAGMFAIKIPVTNGRQMLPVDRDAQAIIAWRLNLTSTSDRWYPVMQRYLSYLNRRIAGLGGGYLPVVLLPVGVIIGAEPCLPHSQGSQHPHQCHECHKCKKCHQCPTY